MSVQFFLVRIALSHWLLFNTVSCYSAFPSSLSKADFLHKVNSTARILINQLTSNLETDENGKRFIDCYYSASTNDDNNGKVSRCYEEPATKENGYNWKLPLCIMVVQVAKSEESNNVPTAPVKRVEVVYRDCFPIEASTLLMNCDFYPTVGSGSQCGIPYGASFSRSKAVCCCIDGLCNDQVFREKAPRKLG